MGFGLFFIPILGGYCLIHRCHWLRLTGREGGYHTLFRAAVAGYLLIPLAWIIEACLIHPFLTNPQVLDSWLQTWILATENQQNAFPLIITLVIGPVVAELINCVYDEDEATEKAMLKSHETLERLFYEVTSRDTSYLLEITTQSGKVYVGWVLGNTTVPARKYLELLPLMSGYRTSPNHKVEFTTHYWRILDVERIKEDEDAASQHRVVVPVSEIISARPFREDVYYSFQQDSPERILAARMGEGGGRAEVPRA